MLNGLRLCYLVIIPVIFPFLIFARLFMKSALFKFIGRVLNKPAGLLFNLSGDYANAFLIGALIGFPSGAKAVREIYLLEPSGRNKNQAERALAFCNNCSISFVVSAAGIAVFNSVRIGFILFFIQMAAAVLTGVITRFIFAQKNLPDAPPIRLDADSRRNDSITEIISEAVSGILNICGTVLFFYIMINITGDILRAAGMSLLSPAVAGIFEVSSGVYSLASLNIDMYRKLLICAAVLGWSGFSVHFQIIYILKDLKLNLRPYFTGKLIHVIIYVLMAALIFRMPETAVMSFASDYYPVFFHAPDNFQAYIGGLIVSAIVTGLVLAVIAAALLVIYILERKNRQKI